LNTATLERAYKLGLVLFFKLRALEWSQRCNMAGAAMVEGHEVPIRTAPTPVAESQTALAECSEDDFPLVRNRGLARWVDEWWRLPRLLGRSFSLDPTGFASVACGLNFSG